MGTRILWGEVWMMGGSLGLVHRLLRKEVGGEEGDPH